jgi:glycosyltransferase involved in cell wall biosynthesis
VSGGQAGEGGNIVTDEYELASIDLVILMPVYDDWDAAGSVIEQIDSVCSDYSLRPIILLVDDGSPVPTPVELVKKRLRQVAAIDVLRLRRNLGHQRAIAIGLTYIFEKVPCDAILVMDADGQDRPEDVPRLIAEFSRAGGQYCIFAERTKRLETPVFKFCYWCYRILHRALTGLGIRVGNFSVIPFQGLSALVVSPELWNHYAAAVFKLRLPLRTVAASRGQRLSGKSTMNFVSLVVHGLSAISVFGEVVGTRALVAAGGVSVLLISSLLGVVAIRLFTNLAIPGWATYTGGLLAVLFVLILATTSSFLFFVLNNRNRASFVPLRDYSLYVQDVKRAYAADA